MPSDEINYNFTENGIVYDFYDVFVSAENFRQPSLWTWGNNSYGQLGINVAGATSGRTTPVTTLLGGTNWKSIAGAYHTVALKTDGSIWTWGYNGWGQLGTNDTVTRSIPVQTILGGNDWKSIAAGGGYTVALKTDGTLWSWGRNNNGQLGVNNTTARITPVQTLGGNDWKSVASGYFHTVAIKTDGTLWTWGYNGWGQLGTNDTLGRTTPVQTILGGNDWKSIACGSSHTIALKTDGSIWTWGNNSYGQLGINVAGATSGRTTPVTTLLGGNDWKSVASGYFHTVAIKTDGTLWSWGRNNNGQLGVNNTTARITPVQTLGGTNWKSIAGGAYHTVAIQYQPDP